MPSASFKDELLAEIKNLRAFAISLSGSISLADDLVQEALLRAWSKSDRFQPGTSLRAWLFTILRNIYYSNYRKRSREVQDSDGACARRLTVPGDQESHLDLEDFRKALAKLPAEQREVLTLIGASGLSYEEAAAICEVEIGTIKSRLSRARSKLVELLGMDETADLPVERRVRRAGAQNPPPANAPRSPSRAARNLFDPFPAEDVPAGDRCGVQRASFNATGQFLRRTPAPAATRASGRLNSPSIQPGSVRGATFPYRERTGRLG